MKGLWRVTTSTIDPGLGVVVFGWIVACVVTLLTCVSIVKKPKHWPELRLLHTGMVLLSIWFVLHWIDTCVRHNKVIVTYSYILSSDFYNVFRVFSDVFVLWGTWRVLTRYKYLEHKLMFRTTTAVAGLFWFLALYHLGLLFALSFAWLSFSDLRAINAIARARNAFEIVFTTLQFCFTTAACVRAIQIAGAGVQGYGTDVLDGTGSPGRRANPPRDTADSVMYKESVLSIPASLALLLRSFCEVIIVGQLDRHPSHIRSIFRGRDVTYGLFSMIFVGFITFAIPPKAAEDPLVRRREDRDRAERAAREDRDRAEEAAREAAMEEVRTWIIDKLKEATENGRRTAPAISTLLDTLKSELDSHRPDPDTFDTWGIKAREVDRLRALYVGWEPVYR